MKAIQVARFGDGRVLRQVEVDAPVPAPHEVVLEVKAAGVNYADIMMRRGFYQGGPRPPFIPGFEVAGVISRLGAEATGVAPGQRVAAVTWGNGYAEQVAAPASGLIPLPDEVSFEEGAAFPVVFLTAYHCLHTAARLAPGESVLIHAAGGGVGTAAVQLAKRAGARIFATASSSAKLDLAAQLGADTCINYRDGDFEAVVKRETAGRGVDVILEAVGGDVFAKSQRCLASGGRLVLLGIAGVQPGVPDVIDLLYRNKSVIGFHLGDLTRTSPDLVSASVAELLAMWVEKDIKTIVGRSFPLAEGAQAQEWISSRESVGKVVLVP